MTPRVGDIYLGWNKTWRVVQVKNGCGKIVNVNDPDNRMTLPVTQFKDLTTGADGSPQGNSVRPQNGD